MTHLKLTFSIILDRVCLHTLRTINTILKSIVIELFIYFKKIIIVIKMTNNNLNNETSPQKTKINASLDYRKELLVNHKPRLVPH